MVVICALLLCACNVVVTKTPLFTHADEAGAPALRSGVWRFDTEASCRFDDKAAYADWPECSAGAIVKGGDAAFYDRKSSAKALQHQDFVLAAGDPRIFQARVSLSGDVSSPDPPYVYAGAKPTKFDPDGRILAIDLWPVQCGPPQTGGNVNAGTLHPLAGLEMKPGDPVCITTSTEVVRAAARASRAWVPKMLHGRWLRDEDKP